MPKNPTYSPSYIKDVIEGIYKRSKHMLTYNPSFVTLDSAIVVYRPSETIVALKNVDYGLAQFARGPTEVRELDGNHLTILRHPELRQAIEECVT